MPVVNQILGGWQIAGITTVQSGLPLNRVLAGGQQARRGPRGNRPNRVGDPFENIPINGYSECGIRTSSTRWPSCQLRSGEIGNEGRATLRFPTYVNTDLNLAKNWRFKEKAIRIQFRAEFFNVFNQDHLQRHISDVCPI